ncbi:amidohydrolase family protein [Fulvivirgaceae bacterium BMA10]|uniref:Amidohydrolase family protein n=1 Tax=Splendidivirga corallicola TaxID=3051826 RepID=A0ABT8KXQ3_9BACT|nr:amidohydrolase family protein [Fulvivirgaceae bacterium BMA10]
MKNIPVLMTTLSILTFIFSFSTGKNVRLIETMQQRINRINTSGFIDTTHRSAPSDISFDINHVVFPMPDSKARNPLDSNDNKYYTSKNQKPAYSDYVKSYVNVDTPLVALVGVKVIDGTGAMSKRDQTIIIDGSNIISVGHKDSVSIPDNTQVLDLIGRTVIPGFVGTHNHMHMPGIPTMYYTAPRLYLACGVTTIQTAGSAAPYVEKNLANTIQLGYAPGPDIIHTGPYITGPGGNRVMIQPESIEQIERAIHYWVDEGVTWFKVYRHIKPEHLQAVIDIAHKNDAKVTGHLCSVTYTEVAKMGIDAIEHGFIHSFDHAPDKETGRCSGSRAFRELINISSTEVKEVHRALIQNNVALSSTLSIFEAQVPGRAIADRRALEAMAPHLVEAYHQRRKRMSEAGKNWYFKETWLKKSMEYDLAFYRSGGLLTAGPDPGLHNLPGYGDQRNFELLVEAGFKPVEAIQVMTSNGAKLLDNPDIGTISVGKTADLVIINGDIEVSPKSIRNTELVFKEGYGFSPEKLIADVKGQVGYR